jgi:hypothetical protein
MAKVVSFFVVKKDMRKNKIQSYINRLKEVKKFVKKIGKSKVVKVKRIIIPFFFIKGNWLRISNIYWSTKFFY